MWRAAASARSAIARRERPHRRLRPLRSGAFVPRASLPCVHVLPTWSHGRAHGGSGHGHSHGDPEEVRRIRDVTMRKHAIFVTNIGAVVNVGLAAAKGCVGVLAHSPALIADGLHSLSDLVTDVVTVWAVHAGRKPADADHPYGHGRIETLGAFSVGALLVAAAGGMAWHSFGALQAVLDIIDPTTLRVLESVAVDAAAAGTSAAHDHAHAFTQMSAGWGLLAMGVAGLSIVLKEGLYRWTMAVARMASSQALVANAWHHRSDAISSFVALGGIAGSMAGLPWLDPVAGMAVAVMIGKAGVSVAFQSIMELTDAAVDDDLVERVRLVANANRYRSRRNGSGSGNGNGNGNGNGSGSGSGSGSGDGLGPASDGDDTAAAPLFPEIVRAGTVRARRMGPYSLIDIQLQVEPRMSVSQANQVAERFRHYILELEPNVAEVIVTVTAVPPQASTRLAHRRAAWQIEDDVRGVVARVGEVLELVHLRVHFIEDEVRPHEEDRLDHGYDHGGHHGVSVHATGGDHAHAHSDERRRHRKQRGDADVEMEILVDPDFTVRQAAAIAARVRLLVENVPDVRMCDVHLELDDVFGSDGSRNPHAPTGPPGARSGAATPASPMPTPGGADADK